MVKEVKELKVEHVLMFAIVAFLLYHFMRGCGCANRGDGFGVGGKTNTKCMSAMKKYCPTNCSSTLQKCQVCTGQHSQIRQAGCIPSDLQNYCTGFVIPDTIHITINASKLVDKVWIDYNNTLQLNYSSGLCKNNNALNINIPTQPDIIHICTFIIDDNNSFDIYWDRTDSTPNNTNILHISLDINGESLYFSHKYLCLWETDDESCVQDALTYINLLNKSNTFIDYVTKLTTWLTNQIHPENYKNIKLSFK